MESSSSANQTNKSPMCLLVC